MSQEQGFAQTFCDVRCEPGEERCLGSCKLKSTSFPVQAQCSPTVSIRDKDGTHLISQSQWLEDVSIALATMEFMLCLFAEHPNRQTILDESAKLGSVALCVIEAEEKVTE
jgi:hypothetical protein